MGRNWIPLIALVLLPLSAIADDSAPPPGHREATVTASDTMLGQAQEVALRALSFIGVRYKWGGSSPDTGFDCSGLIRYVYSQVTGQSLPYNAREMSGVGTTVDRAELQPGDLVFFNTLRKPFSHVGIYLGGNRFVHAPSSGKRVRVDTLTDVYWQKHLVDARRF